MLASTYLRESTRAAHRATEQAAKSEIIMSGRIDPAGYGNLLLANYTVWNQMDRQFDSFSLYTAELDWKKWVPTLSSFLSSDLRALAIVPEYTPLAAPLIKSTADALGACYVLNGSLLGGVYIYRALQNNLALRDHNAFRFYRQCSKVRREDWTAFQRFLDAKLRSLSALEQAAATANAVFQLFQQAYLQTDLNTNLHNR